MHHLGRPSTSKQDDNFEDDEIFDDSTFLANFDNTFFKQANVREGNVNDSINNGALNVSALCCDEEISGYDKLTGRTWIYPTNYPVRDYQFNIIKAALVKNTLVSLPTGLGKTFIAAVIMYNFYRWYPLGKIVFTAPTRPLVAQQIDACYNIIAIPPNDTIEMTGHMAINIRKSHWQNKRVFFATPQVIYNDLKSGICPADKIRCLVFDEAHRARGNYAYCQIIATLDEMGHKTYRMLALSATPGSKVDDVINVVRSLHIAHLELRTENCIDVAPYSHSRKISTVVVPLGPDLTYLRQHYVEILDGYARRLKQFNILPQNLGNLSKGRVVMLYKEYQTKDRGQRHHQHNYIMKDFTILISLYHGLELLLKHGSRVFLNFFDEHPEKSWIHADDNLTALLERLRDDLGVNPLSLDRSMLPDGTIPEMPKDLCFGHPKFDKLKSIIMDHFTSAKQKNQDTRAIIFCEYRESVNLVHCLLLQCRPLVAPEMFVGQGASGKDGKTVVSQKQQLRVMRRFREGQCNTLVATCVAEEGLDVGSVDLIVCFDISNRSPIRLVQRCGRTGRERGGQVYILVTEGREHQTLLDCMRQRDGLNKKVLQSKEVANNLYAANPRMMPRHVTPECRKMYITVEKRGDSKDAADKTAKKGQKNLRSMLLNNRASTSNSTSKETDKSALITEDEFKQLFPGGYESKQLLPRSSNHWAMSKETLKSRAIEPTTEKILNLASWLEWQRMLQSTVNIGHSKQTEFLSNILQKCDEKRLQPTQMSQPPVIDIEELPPQNFAAPEQLKNIASPAKPIKQTKKKPKATVVKSPAKNYGDIRALFSTATKSTKNYTKLINDLGIRIQNDGSVPTSLLNLLVDLNLNVDSTANTNKCYVCESVCDCKILSLKKNQRNQKNLKQFLADPILPDVDLINDIDTEDIIKCRKDNKASQNVLICDIKDNATISKNDKANYSANFDLELDLDALDEIRTPSPVVADTAQVSMSSDKNFDLGDIDDIFADSSPEEAIDKVVQTVNEPEIVNEENSKATGTQQALGFFGLNSIDDIFAEYDDDGLDIDNYRINTNCSKEKPKEIQKPSVLKLGTEVSNKKKEIIIKVKDRVPNMARPLSPSILTGKKAVKETSSSPSSPILCSQAVRKLPRNTTKKQPNSSTPKSNVKRKLTTCNSNVIIIDDETDNNLIQSSAVDKTDKSMFTITQIVEMINKTNDKSIKDSEKSKKDNTKSKIADNVRENERSVSPILFTQADRNRYSNSSKVITKINENKSKSLIILNSDSESDSEQTQSYNIEEEISKMDANVTLPRSANQTGNKRKFEDDSFSIACSPYFNKKPKLDNLQTKPLTLQDKVLAALSSNKAKERICNKDSPKRQNNQTNFQVTVSPPLVFSQKENLNPVSKTNNYNDDENEIHPSPIEVLQKYRKASKLLTLRNKFDTIFKKSPKKQEISPKKNIEQFEEGDDSELNERLSSPLKSENKENTPVKRKISFDSDDDFMSDDKDTSHSPKKPSNHRKEVRSTTNHKVRKKKRPRNSFIEMEASLSGSGSDSGDELSDDSVGSIADFINDNDVTRQDIQAIYIQSIRSPVRNNGFKIPELPKKYKREDILSQFVEEDAYEIDSFCVDSNVGLTQANDISELELAEIVLEEKRRSKKKGKPPPTQTNIESPLIRKPKKNCKRRIQSDSDDSS